VTNTGTVTDTYDLQLAGPAALVSNLGMEQVTLAPGASQVVPITTGSVDFAVQGNLNLMAAATSTSDPAIQGAASADLAIPATHGMTASFSPATQTLSSPGTATFLLTVQNTGNAEDSYSATIIGTNGPVAATLIGLDGSPTQSIPTFFLPGLSTGEIELQVNLSAIGQGTVTVQVKSLTNAESMSPTALTIVSPALVITPSPSPHSGNQISTPSSGGPEITEVKRYGYHLMPTTIVLTFDQALDPAAAQDVHNYRIVSEQGHHIKVRRAVYDAANQTVTLHLAQRLSIHHPYKLTVVGTGQQGLSNSQRELLDSVGNDQPGADYHLELTWRELVLGDVSRQFLIRYHILPKGPQPKIRSGESRPKFHADHPVVHSRGLFTRSVSFPLRPSTGRSRHEPVPVRG
jgi:hypothetical protein